MTIRRMRCPLKALVKEHVSASIDRVLLAAAALSGAALRASSHRLSSDLALLLQRLPGNIIGCGVYRAGTTVLLARMLSQPDLAKRSAPLTPSGASPARSKR